MSSQQPTGRMTGGKGDGVWGGSREWGLHAGDPNSGMLSEKIPIDQTSWERMVIFMNRSP